MKDVSTKGPVSANALSPSDLSCKIPAKHFILLPVKAQAAPQFSASGRTTLPPNGVNTRELRAIVILASSRP